MCKIFISEAAAAKKIDCTVPMLSRYENGESNITVDFLHRLSVAYNVDIADIFKLVSFTLKALNGTKPYDIFATQNNIDSTIKRLSENLIYLNLEN